MGTSPTETLSVAGNIFVGQVLWQQPESDVASETSCLNSLIFLLSSSSRLRLHYWSAHTWWIWPNRRFTLWWPVVLPPLQAASWGRSSHLGWDEAAAQAYLGRWKNNGCYLHPGSWLWVRVSLPPQLIFSLKENIVRPSFTLTCDQSFCILLYFADRCFFPDRSVCDGCSLCLGHLQTFLPRDGGESFQVRGEG